MCVEMPLEKVKEQDKVAVNYSSDNEHEANSQLLKCSLINVILYIIINNYCGNVKRSIPLVLNSCGSTMARNLSNLNSITACWTKYFRKR